MAEELAEVLQRFKLSSKEAEGVVVTDDAFEKEGECRLSLIGKVIGEKAANFTGIRNFVNFMWNHPKNLKVVELGVNLFQFSFGLQEDVDRVMQGCPYLIDNQLLNLKRWERGIDKNPKAFMIAPLWIQMWNLPIHCITREVGRKIGSLFCKVTDVIVPPGGSRDGKHLKVLVEADISQPLLRGSMVKLDGTVSWVDFRYERCPDFCYNCGIVGHGEKNCTDKLGNIRNQSRNQYGMWLRAQGMKASPKKHQEKRNKESSSPAKAKASDCKGQGEKCNQDDLGQVTESAEKLQVQDAFVKRKIDSSSVREKLVADNGTTIPVQGMDNLGKIRNEMDRIHAIVGYENGNQANQSASMMIDQSLEAQEGNENLPASPEFDKCTGENEHNKQEREESSSNHARKQKRQLRTQGRGGQNRNPLGQLDSNIIRDVSSGKRKFFLRDEAEDNQVEEGKMIGGKRSKGNELKEGVWTEAMEGVETSRIWPPTNQ